MKFPTEWKIKTSSKPPTRPFWGWWLWHGFNSIYPRHLAAPAYMLRWHCWWLAHLLCWRCSIDTAWTMECQTLQGIFWNIPWPIQENQRNILSLSNPIVTWWLGGPITLSSWDCDYPQKVIGSLGYTNYIYLFDPPWLSRIFPPRSPKHIHQDAPPFAHVCTDGPTNSSKWTSNDRTSVIGIAISFTLWYTNIAIENGNQLFQYVLPIAM